MLSYLVYAIVYNYVFEELPPKKDVDIVEESIQLWYPMLWKHKASFHVYQIHDSFLGRCRALLTRATLEKNTQNAKAFLERKGLFYFEKEYSYI